MAKKIKWSPLAERKFDEILAYWTNRNKSESFSEKLIDLFEDATELIANFPEMGRSTDIENVRQKLVRDYLIFHEVDGEIINILTVWDPRQNPDKLELISSESVLQDKKDLFDIDETYPYPKE